MVVGETLPSWVQEKLGQYGKGEIVEGDGVRKDGPRGAPNGASRAAVNKGKLS